jgi:hypothetical protein
MGWHQQFRQPRYIVKESFDLDQGQGHLIADHSASTSRLVAPG